MTTLNKVAASRNKHRYTSSGPLSADTLITSTSGTVGAVLIIDGGAAATVSLHNSTDNTGTELWRWVTGGDGLPVGHEGMEMVFNTALYLDITGTAEVWVLYRED